ncbi:MAG: hypothetical protein ACN6P8_22505, partial [Achromobacter piechaudii]
MTRQGIERLELPAQGYPPARGYPPGSDSFKRKKTARRRFFLARVAPAYFFFIMSKNSALVLVARILSRMNS